MNKSKFFILGIISSSGIIHSCITPSSYIQPSASSASSSASSILFSVMPSSSASVGDILTSTPTSTATSNSLPSSTTSSGFNSSQALNISSNLLKLSYYDYYSAELKWSSVLGANSYSIYQDGKLIANNLKDFIYMVKNLTPHTNYSFDIVAVNEAGESNKSTIKMRTFIPSSSSSNNYNNTQLYPVAFETTVPSLVPSYGPTTFPSTTINYYYPTSVATTLYYFPTTIQTTVQSYGPPPSYSPTTSPTTIQTTIPTYLPTYVPTYIPTYVPTYVPTSSGPTTSPTAVPTTIIRYQ